MIFAGYTGSKNPTRNRLKIQFVKLDFSKLIFQKSSTYQHINFDLTLLSQSGIAIPSFSQVLDSTKIFGHGSPPFLGYLEIDLIFVTGTIVEMVNYNFIGIQR